MTQKPDNKEAWGRFERAVDAAVKSAPKHRPAATDKPLKATVGAPSSAKKKKSAP